MLKIGYFADGQWSHNAFELLILDVNIKIAFICVRFDTQDEILKNHAKKYKIPYLKHKNVNSDEFVKLVTTYNVDLFVSMSFDQIFKSNIINIPDLKTINCHAGMLPFYRGRNVLNWALINDENQFGITVHFVDEGIDTGDIILQKTFNITDKDNYMTLLERSYEQCAKILYEAVLLFIDDKVKAIPQNSIHPVGLFCSKRKQGDERLNWKQDSRVIFNFVRALCIPGPQAKTYLNGKEFLINKITLIKDAPSYIGVVGAILFRDSSGFFVKTNDSFVKVTEYSYDGVFKVGDRFDI